MGTYIRAKNSQNRQSLNKAKSKQKRISMTKDKQSNRQNFYKSIWTEM